jgi:NADH:ubiquinone oxidoreductase subunit H
MTVGWLYLMPIAIANVIVTALVIFALQRMGLVA